MSKTKQIFRKWLPMALVPMMSVAVLNGCSSDDDDEVVDETPVVVVGDTDGNGIADAFEASITGGEDANGDNIDDIFAVTETGTDSNENDIDDSFEASLTGGVDVDPMDGVDDEAAAALLVGGEGPDGGDGEGPDGGDGEGPDGGDGEGPDGGDGEGPGVGSETGSLGPLVLGNDSDALGVVGTVDLSWDGTTLSGTVNPDDSIGATAAWLYTGIAASNSPGMIEMQLNGSAPQFSFPTGQSDDQKASIAAALETGNLFILVESASGQVRSDQLLPPGSTVIATFTTLELADSAGFSTGAAYMNVNTTTAAYTAYLDVNLNPEDTDSDGVPISIAAAHIHDGSIEGDIIVTLADTGAGIAFSATGVLSDEELAIITSNNGWFNVHQNDGTTPGATFMNGQIQLEN